MLLLLPIAAIIVGALCFVFWDVQRCIERSTYRPFDQEVD